MDYISGRRDSSFVDFWEWRVVIEKVYGLENFWYVARKNGRIEGFLGLALAQHPLFGRYLITAPFASQGGFYADSEDAYRGLLDKAGELQDRIHARYTVVRQLDPVWSAPSGWHRDHSYATYHLPLTKDLGSFLRENNRGNLRYEIKSCSNRGLKVSFGGLELVEDVWIVINRAMKDLGSPYHAKRYLEILKETMGSRAMVVLCRTADGRSVGGGVVISHEDRTDVLHMNALKEYRSMHVSDFLYWSLIQECHSRNIRLIDMGRSLVGSGNERYKMKWRPIRHLLSYSYRLSPGEKVPQLNQGNPRLKLAIRVWQRMPCFVADALGPRLISGLL
jgi:FemAB-related protein (PEP-CTERM system-associated)